jgi:hypothetical protein
MKPFSFIPTIQSEEKERKKRQPKLISVGKILLTISAALKRERLTILHFSRIYSLPRHKQECKHGHPSVEKTESEM